MKCNYCITMAHQICGAQKKERTHYVCKKCRADGKLGCSKCRFREGGCGACKKTSG